MTLAPTFELLVNGQRLPESVRRTLDGVTVEATIEAADELTITAGAWDSIAGAWRIVGEDVLGLGNLVVVRVGYGRELVALQRFEVTRHEPEYPNNGLPRVTVRAYSAEHRLVAETKPRTWTEVSDSEVVRQLAEEHGLTTTAESLQDIVGINPSRVKPAGTTDWEFLCKLAAASGFAPPLVRYDEDLDRDVLFFRDFDLDVVQTEIPELVYLPGADRTGSLWSFRPQLSLAGAPTKVRVDGFDQDTQEPIAVVLEITRNGERTTIYRGGEVTEIGEAPRSPGQLQVAIIDDGNASAKRSKTEVLSVESVATEEDARDFARRWIDTRRRAFSTASGECRGDTRLWAGTVVRVLGVSDQDAGLWQLRECTHVVDSSGYRVVINDSNRVLEDAADPVETSPEGNE